MSKGCPSQGPLYSWISLCVSTGIWSGEDSNSYFCAFPCADLCIFEGVDFVHNNSDQMLSQFPSTFFIIHVFASSLKIYPVTLESQWKGLFSIFAEATVKREMFSLPWLQPVAICFSKCSQTRGRKMCWKNSCETWVFFTMVFLNIYI